MIINTEYLLLCLRKSELCAGIKLTADLISDDFHVYPVQAQTASDDELRQKLIDSRLSLVTNFAVIVELATQLESLLQMVYMKTMYRIKYKWCVVVEIDAMLVGCRYVTQSSYRPIL